MQQPNKKNRSSKKTYPRLCFGLFSITVAYLVFKALTDWEHWLFVPVEFFGPIVFLMSLVLLVLAVIKRRWVCVVLSVVTVTTWAPNVSGMMAFTRGSGLPPNQESSISVMSYNVMMFRGADSSPRTRRSLANEIVELGADIQCLQEFKFPLLRKGEPSQEEISSYFKKEGYSAFVPDPVRTGPVILSRFEIVNSGRVYTPSYAGLANGAVYVDVAADSGVLRVYSVHFGSITRLLDEGRRFRAGKKSSFLEANISLAETKRAQINHLLASVARSPHPVIVCGDFNDIPSGYVYQRLRKELKNSFEDKGRGIGGTSNKDWLRHARIDHVFVGKEVDVLAFSTRKDIDLSDHYPIFGEFRINQN